MPCMYMELAAGQYFQSGNITIWAKMSPYMKGIGYTVLIVNLLMLSYYNTLQGYAIYYLAYSFRSPVPWSTCQNKWNTDKCHVRDAFANHTNSTDVIAEDAYLPSSEFFTRKVLGAHLSTGFHDLHGLKFDLLLCVFIVFVISTLCLIKGIKTSGKAVYVTALLPYLCLAVLIVQSLLLDGSIDGLKYYLTPQFDQLFKLQVWLAAAIQIFFSLGPGFGVLITYSSYSSQKTNIRRLTFMCSLVNCFTSLLYGVVVFAGLGYMAKRINKDINYFLRDGIGLVFAVYPEIISTFKGAYIYAVIFFVMLITLGLDSTFAGMEGLYTAISDEYPIFKRHSILTRIGISAIPFLTSIPTISYGGIYVVQWMDTFAISPSVLLVVFAEVITVSWLYGLSRFSANIEEMNHTKPFIIWRLSWKFLCPVVLFTIVALDIAFFQGLTYGDYTFPRWSTILGYSLNAVALTPILAYMLFYFVKLRFFSKRV